MVLEYILRNEQVCANGRLATEEQHTERFGQHTLEESTSSLSQEQNDDWNESVVEDNNTVVESSFIPENSILMNLANLLTESEKVSIDEFHDKMESIMKEFHENRYENSAKVTLDKMERLIDEYLKRKIKLNLRCDQYECTVSNFVFKKIIDIANASSVMRITPKWQKRSTGFYLAESEGASFWLGVLNDLKERGIEDILIACVDGLKSFPAAINSVFPNVEVQLCVVHQIRNSLKYASSKDVKVFMNDLKKIYRATSKEIAENYLLELEEKWGEKYPLVVKSWQNNWESLSGYFKYSGPVRRLIYTTNPIEGLHRQIRKFTKTKGAFSSINALYKLVYCAIRKVEEKWTMPVHDWALSISQLDIFFPSRLKIELN